MKRIILGFALALTLLLGASPAYAAEIPEPLALSTVNCPIQLFYHNPQTGLTEEVNFIEPDFETPPENYLYEICNRYTYEVRFQPPIEGELSNAFKVDYSSDVKNGDLGTITIEYADLVMTETGPAQTTYHGELKFVATGDLKLQYTMVTVDANNQLTLQLSTNDTSRNHGGVSFTHIDTPVCITSSDTSQDLYTTDLHSYLYPSTFAAFQKTSRSPLNTCQYFLQKLNK